MEERTSRDPNSTHACKWCGDECDCAAEFRFECQACTLCYQGFLEDGDVNEEWDD